MTRLFLDSVIIDEIRKYSWLVSGVTTTPTFFKREGINYETFVSSFRKEFPDIELHLEALGPTAESTEKQLRRIIRKEWFNSEKVVIKIPVSYENLQIISRYSGDNIRFNTHLIFTPGQAYLAAVSGTTYVCPLIGRYADNISKTSNKTVRGGENDVGKKLLMDVIQAVSNCQTIQPVKVMASSIRTIDDFQNSIAAKADIVTVPTKILEESLKHEYTDLGIKTFLSDMGY